MAKDDQSDSLDGVRASASARAVHRLTLYSSLRLSSVSMLHRQVTPPCQCDSENHWPASCRPCPTDKKYLADESFAPG